MTFPSSTLTSSFETSAMRRSRSDLPAVSTAFLVASSQDDSLVPMTSMIRYTPSPTDALAMISSPFKRSPAAEYSHNMPLRTRADLRSFISRCACPDTAETRPFQYGGIPVGLADSYGGRITQVLW